jgi:hypothetical protein
LLGRASVVLSSPILVTLMKEALGSSETSVLARATQRNIPEDTILHSHRRENLKSNTSLTLLHILKAPVCDLNPSTGCPKSESLSLMRVPFVQVLG